MTEEKKKEELSQPTSVEVDNTEVVQKVKKEGSVKRAQELMKLYEGVKSPTIRKMHSEGYDRGQIAAALGIRYQHVRNVLITPLTSKKRF